MIRDWFLSCVQAWIKHSKKAKGPFFALPMDQYPVNTTNISIDTIGVDAFIGSQLSQTFIEGWGDLCENGPITHPFCRPEFILAQAAVENRLDDLRILAVRIDNVLKGVLPLKFHKKRLYGVIPVTILGSGGGELTSRFDIVIASETVRQTVVDALWKELQKEKWDMLVFNDIVEGSVLEHLFSKARVNKYPVRQQKTKSSPYRELNAQELSGESSIDPISNKMRQELVRLERKLAKAGQFRVLCCENNDLVLWEQFLNLENAGWKGKTGNSILRDSEQKLFIENVMEAVANRNYLIWHFLTFNDTIIAMQFGLIWKKRYFGLKIAYDETYSSYGPGFLLTKEIFRDIAVKGVIEYDFLGKDEAYKLRWTSTVRDHIQWHVYSPSVLMWLLSRFQSIIVPLVKRSFKRGLR